MLKILEMNILDTMSQGIARLPMTSHAPSFERESASVLELGAQEAGLGVNVEVVQQLVVSHLAAFERKVSPTQQECKCEEMLFDLCIDPEMYTQILKD